MHPTAQHHPTMPFAPSQPVPSLQQQQQLLLLQQQAFFRQYHSVVNQQQGIRDPQSSSSEGDDAAGSSSSSRSVSPASPHDINSSPSRQKNSSGAAPTATTQNCGTGGPAAKPVSRGIVPQPQQQILPNVNQPPRVIVHPSSVSDVTGNASRHPNGSMGSGRVMGLAQVGGSCAGRPFPFRVENMPLQTSSVTTASASTYLQHLKLIEETSLALHSWSIKAQQSGDMPEYVGRRFLAKASDAVHLLNAMTALVPPPLRQSLGDMFLNNVKLPPSYLPPSHHHHSTESHTNRPVVTPCQPQLPLCETSKPLAQASSSEKNRPLSPERADKLLEMLKERRPHPPPPAVPASPQPVTQGRPPASNPPKRRRASNAGQKTPRNTVNTLSPTQNMNSPQTPNTQGRAESTSPCKKKSPKGIADPNSGLMENSTGEPLYRTGSYPSECAPLSEKGSFCRDTPATEMSRNGSFDSVDSVGRCPSFPTMDGSNPLAKSASFSVADSGRNLEAKRVMSCDSIKVPIPSRSTETRSYVTALGYASSVPPPNPPCNFRGSGNILPAIVTSPSCNQPPQQNDDCEEGSGSCGNSEDEQPQPSGSLSSKMKIKRHRRESGPYKRPSQFPAHEVPNHLHELVDISELESTQKIESFSTTTSSTINNSATPPPTNQLPPIIQLPSSPPSLPPASRQDQLKPHRQLVSATESGSKKILSLNSLLS